jgi:hypothetical protein
MKRTYNKPTVQVGNCWKVLTPWRDSICAPAGWALKYPRGQRVHRQPVCGYLATFASLDAAEAFVRSCAPFTFVIVPATGESLVSYHEVTCPFWTPPTPDTPGMTQMTAPAGTMLAEAVTCLL